LILTGDLIDAQEAHRIGLVNEVVPLALLSRCEAILKQIGANAPLAIRYWIGAVNEGIETDLTSGLKLEAKYFALAAGTEDRKKGTSAFVQERVPQFKVSGCLVSAEAKTSSSQCIHSTSTTGTCNCVTGARLLVSRCSDFSRFPDHDRSR
jgi:hypothetical protein